MSRENLLAFYERVYHDDDLRKSYDAVSSDWGAVQTLCREQGFDVSSLGSTDAQRVVDYLNGQLEELDEEEFEMIAGGVGGSTPARWGTIPDPPQPDFSGNFG